MNILDIIIIAVLGLSTLYGFYHGFLRTILSVFGAGLSIVAALIFGPQLAALIGSQPFVTDNLATYTDAIARVGDFDLASSRVSELNQNVLDTIMKSVRLPDPLADLLKTNLTTSAFSGKGLNTVNDYVSTTIINSALQLISFLLVFFAAFLLIKMIIGLLHHVLRFPILKQLDWLAGGGFGLLRGALIVYLLLLLLPLVQTVAPGDQVNALLTGSRLAETFSSPELFLRIIQSK